MTRTALALIAAAGLCLTAAAHAPASTLNFADYPDVWNNNTQGTLDGVGFTLSFFDGQSAGNTTINLTTSTFDSAGAASEEAATYSNGPGFSITFDQEIYDFALYLNQFRSANQGGSNQYSFTGVAGFGRDDFTLNDAFVGATKSSNAINLTESFASGILRFSDPVTVLTVFSSPLQGFPQAFTFSGNAQPVPEPTSIAFLATGGLAIGGLAAARRRRMCRSAGSRLWCSRWQAKRSNTCPAKGCRPPTRGPAAHEPLISLAIVADVPLAGLSLTEKPGCRPPS